MHVDGSRVATAATLLLLFACGGGSSAPPSQPPAANPPATPPTAFRLPAPTSFAKSTRAFVDVAVLPMTAPGAFLDRQTVIVRDGIIEQIGPSDIVVVPDDAERIDGTGRYLMPGLADMHVHTTNANDLFLNLANGITLVRMMWGTETALERRAEIDTEQILAPRYFTAGRGMDGSPPFWPETEIVETALDGRQAVQRQHQAGYDFIKVYNRLNRAAYDAIIDEAATLGVPVIGHVPGAVDIEHALDSAHLGTEHLLGYARLVTASGANNWNDVIDETRLEPAARRVRDSGTWTSPTLTVLNRTQNDVARVTSSAGWRYISPDLREWLAGPNTQPPAGRNPRADANRKRMVSALHAAGAPLLLGTDTGVQYLIPGFSLHEELDHWIDAGLTPAEVLHVATSEAAGFLGLDGVIGTIEPGAEADLLLLAADPRADIAHVQQRIGVMLRGRWYAEEQLQNWLEDIAAGYGR